MISEGRLAYILELLVKMDNIFEIAWEDEKEDVSFGDYMAEVHAGLKRVIFHHRILDKPMERDEAENPSGYRDESHGR